MRLEQRRVRILNASQLMSKVKRPMLHVAEPSALHTPWLYDIGKLALLALVLVPIYLLVNELWQSLFRLVVLYGLLALFCIRLGEYMHRAMRRLPAEIPPWSGLPPAAPVPLWMEQRFGAAEAILSAHRDPQYVQAVLKPRLRRLLVYRLHGTPDLPMEDLDTARLSQVEPALLDFIQRQENVGVWARFRYRRQRDADVRDALQSLEAL
jgi:hypothetical protein